MDTYCVFLENTSGVTYSRDSGRPIAKNKPYIAHKDTAQPEEEAYSQEHQD